MVVLLWCVAALLGVAGCSLLAGRWAAAGRSVYGATLAVSATALGTALTALAGGPTAITLPLGLPWLGAHFRVDALAAFFLAVVNLGGAAASLYGIGYGQHEHEPRRVLPFFPAFLAGMNLVLLADDAFTFLFSWEFMSLASWALVMAHHREPANVARRLCLHLVMASFGTLALLLAFGLLAGPDGGYAFAAIRVHSHPACVAALVPGSRPARRRIEGRPRALARLAAARASGGAEPCLRADERRHDQSRGLWLRPDRLRPPRPAGLVVGRPVLSLGGGTAVLGILYALMQRTSSGSSPTARSRTSASFSSALASRSLSRPTGCRQLAPSR